MSNEQNLTWWQEQLSGLEIDACPAIDMPDNAQGGAFASLTVTAGRIGNRDDLTAAFAYALGKYTSQNESLFWVREDGAYYPGLSRQRRLKSLGGAPAPRPGGGRAVGGALFEPGAAAAP